MDLAPSLPTLSFRLRPHLLLEQQPLLTLPLSDLVLEPEPSNPNRTLCLVRGPVLSEPSYAAADSPAGMDWSREYQVRACVCFVLGMNGIGVHTLICIDSAASMTRQ